MDAAFLSGWEQVSNDSYQQFVAAEDDLRQLSEQKTKLLDDPRIKVHQKGSRSLSVSEIKRLAKSVSDTDVKKILTQVLACDDATKKTAARIRTFREVAEGEILPMLEKEPLPESLSDLRILNEWLNLDKQITALRRQLKQAEAELDTKAYEHYPKLTEAEIKTLVVDDKWLATLDAIIHGEMDRVSRQLTQSVEELAERYETPMPRLSDRVADLEMKVNGHLERMGFAWK